MHRSAASILEAALVATEVLNEFEDVHVAKAARSQRWLSIPFHQSVQGVVDRQEVMQVLRRDEEVRQPRQLVLGVLFGFQFVLHGLHLLGREHDEQLNRAGLIEQV